MAGRTTRCQRTQQFSDERHDMASIRIVLIFLALISLSAPSPALDEPAYAALRAVSQPAQSPTGRSVAYRVRYIDLKANRLIEEIRVQATRGGEARTLGEGRAPQWSADEQWLAYCRRVRCIG
jgi:hypothetical protein